MMQHHSMPIKTMEAMDTTMETPTITDKEDAVQNTEEIW